MFPMQEFMQGLDKIYQSGNIHQAESYLLQGIRHTENTEPEAALVLLNELIGYYRVMSCHQQGAECAARALELIQQTGMQGTVNHGTTLLNAATGFRAAGNYKQADSCYQMAQKILESQLNGPDYRLASLYNNMALLYSQTGRLEQAYDHMLKALQLTEQMPDMETELAITYTNLGNICFGMNKAEKGTEYMQKAVALFEKHSDHPNPHYPAALSGLGEASFHKGELDQAVAYYKESLHWIEQIYGKNDDWKTTQANLEIVESLIERRNAITASKMNGLELSRAYYEEVGKPMLQAKYPEYVGRIAVGLVGEGSECLGFDDQYSTDHDFGPGFCMWLTKEDYDKIGKSLQADYDALADKWRGFPVRNTTAEGAGRVGVLQIDEFYQNFTGYTEAPSAETLQDVLCWSEIPTEMLCTAVNGSVFVDELGEFTRRREAFAQYPEPVRLCRLARTLSKMAQAGQYNYSRAQKRGDLGMMYSSLSEFIQAAAEAGYLLNHRYMPFYKWRIHGMEQFERLKNLKPMLEQLMQKTADNAAITGEIEEICDYVLKELKAQNLTESDETFLDRQKEFVLHRMREFLNTKKKSLKENTMETLLKEMSANKKDLVDRIVVAEWEQFQKARNEGGEAECQHNWPTFEIMRKSQFYTWDEDVLVSYLEDLTEAAQNGWNMVAEKYARMMEHTAPDQYKLLEKNLPARSEMRRNLQEQLAKIYMQWMREMHERYPELMKTGRHISENEDSEWDTSSETYLKGEMGTYSEKTIQLYGRMMVARLKENRNQVEENMNYMVHFYGYKTLQQANEQCAKEAR